MSMAGNLLIKLSGLYEKIKELDIYKEERKKNLLTAEQKAEIERIEAFYQTEREPLLESITDIETRLKAIVLEKKESIKEAGIHAIWNPGRISWDNSGLEGFMIEHPEIKRFRKKGKPYVSIKKAK